MKSYGGVGGRGGGGELRRRRLYVWGGGMEEDGGWGWGGGWSMGRRQPIPDAQSSQLKTSSAARGRLLAHRIRNGLRTASSSKTADTRGVRVSLAVLMTV